jgi:hypothetical protein
MQEKASYLRQEVDYLLGSELPRYQKFDEAATELTLEQIDSVEFGEFRFVFRVPRKVFYVMSPPRSLELKDSIAKNAASAFEQHARKQLG